MNKILCALCSKHGLRTQISKSKNNNRRMLDLGGSGKKQQVCKSCFWEVKCIERGYTARMARD